MRVTSKGQVTIPRDLRERAGIAPNSNVLFALENGRIVIIPGEPVGDVEEAARMEHFLRVLDRLESTGDMDLKAEDVLAETRGPHS